MATETPLITAVHNNTSPIITAVHNNTSPITMVTFPSSLKLTSTNYLSWKTQIEALLQGLDLYKFIDGTHLAPIPTMNADGSITPHVNYNTWFRQDRLLYGAIVGSLSAPIVPLITNATSSLEAWKILSNTYASPSRGHIKQLQHRLKQSTKTNDQTITDYMQSIKVLVDELSILGKTMDSEDVTDIILSGLDKKQYKPVIEAIHARDNPILFHELHEKLINHELSIAQQTVPSPNIHQPITAFAAHTRHQPKQWPNRNPNNGSGLLPTPPPNSNTYPNTPPKPFLGKCQWCFNKGHSLTSCYSFKKAHPTISLPTYNKANSSSKPQVHMVSTNNYGTDLPWLYDSGASHHITNDLNALSMHNPYDGTDDLIIGDGSSDQSPPTPSNGKPGTI